MNSKTAPQSYNMALRYLHWIMFLLLVAVYASIEMRVFFEKGTDLRNAFKAWHFMLGLSVFAAVWLRLVLRFNQRYPAVQPALPAWQKAMSYLTHVLLYVLMLAMPLSGWLILSGEAKAIPFGLPALMAENKDLAHQLEEWHELAGKVGYFLIGLHVLAAAYHQFIRKDNVFKRMWIK
ncbi:cytochrome b [Dasania sp. GY-MA-18]|uniref:Cytochrome b n=1 Tax=Dasania phycosphaerae TaxID=2950436 RepID=A0A9J6RPK6_9GAMM|nr:MULTISPECIES: cytochrome b [Dasania]MCR8923613.1 cytochrome b [Dasania sp. GY-MA-18]MCZ0866047.1 cytochrome b [Dasania phycosphaerae]MCZ0869771.1 cytochrome b [Dasania phycosphaerae]